MESFIQFRLNKVNLHKLSQKKYRDQWEMYLIEGNAAIRDAIGYSAPVVAIVYDERVENRKQDTLLLEESRARGIRVEKFDQKDLQLLSDLTTPPPVIALVHKKERPLPELSELNGLVLSLDNVSDPGNVGSLIRAAAFYGVEQIWLGKGCVDLYNPKVIRAAMGCHLIVNLHQDIDLVALLNEAKMENFLILASNVENGVSPAPWQTLGSTLSSRHSASPPKGAVLVLGNEAHGVNNEIDSLADLMLAIPRVGLVDSLNVAMAGTVLLDRLQRS
ncbi:RNA methyltransferase [bacterium]|nr:RNA methyltransferase [bacterium]